MKHYHKNTKALSFSTGNEDSRILELEKKLVEKEEEVLGLENEVYPGR